MHDRVSARRGEKAVYVENSPKKQKKKPDSKPQQGRWAQLAASARKGMSVFKRKEQNAKPSGGAPAQHVKKRIKNGVDRTGKNLKKAGKSGVKLLNNRAVQNGLQTARKNGQKILKKGRELANSKPVRKGRDAVKDGVNRVRNSKTVKKTVQRVGDNLGKTKEKSVKLQKNDALQGAAGKVRQYLDKAKIASKNAMDNENVQKGVQKGQSAGRKVGKSLSEGPQSKGDRAHEKARKATEKTRNYMRKAREKAGELFSGKKTKYTSEKSGQKQDKPGTRFGTAEKQKKYSTQQLRSKGVQAKPSKPKITLSKYAADPSQNARQTKKPAAVIAKQQNKRQRFRFF